jgi:hypothetical protein
MDNLILPLTALFCAAAAVTAVLWILAALGLTP